MVRILIKAAIFLGTGALGFLIAGALVGGVHVTVPGFAVGVIVFTVAQSIIAPIAEKLAAKASRPVVGMMGLVSTALALLLASLFAGGITFDGPISWLLGALVVWLVSALGWWLLPIWFLKEKKAARTK